MQKMRNLDYFLVRMSIMLAASTFGSKRAPNVLFAKPIFPLTNINENEITCKYKHLYICTYHNTECVLYLFILQSEMDIYLKISKSKVFSSFCVKSR
jgi:hypothetical protein